MKRPYQQPHEDRKAFRRRIIGDVRSACDELDYENETSRSSFDRVEQIIGWLLVLLVDGEKP